MYPFSDSVVWRWVGPPPGVKNRTPLGLTSAAAPEKSLLPRDGSVLLGFLSSSLLLTLAADKSNHSCLGWAWQRLQKCCSKAAVRHGEAGRKEGAAEGNPEIFRVKREQKDLGLQAASPQQRHKGYCSLCLFFFLTM